MFEGELSDLPFAAIFKAGASTMLPQILRILIDAVKERKSEKYFNWLTVLVVLVRIEMW